MNKIVVSKLSENINDKSKRLNISNACWTELNMYWRSFFEDNNKGYTYLMDYCNDVYNATYQILKINIWDDELCKINFIDNFFTWLVNKADSFEKRYLDYFDKNIIKIYFNTINIDTFDSLINSVIKYSFYKKTDDCIILPCEETEIIPVNINNIHDLF